VDDPDAAASFNVEFQIPDWYASARQGSVRITAATTQEVRGTLDVQFDQMQGVEVIGSGRLTGSFVARHSDQPDWTP
jgi:GAF domain-containing protein